MSQYQRTMGKDVDLKAEQKKTMETPVMSANPILRMMYVTMDILYGKAPTLPKFRVIEILARYPYWAWEHGGYSRITSAHCRGDFAKKDVVERALRHIEMGRTDQDNEQWHLMLIEDIMRQKGIKQGWFRRALLPQLMAISYLGLSEAIYQLRPTLFFSMNARFESHAEHEYAKLVEAYPEWEDEPVETDVFEHYPRQTTLANLFRRIGLDERDHMNESREEYERLTGKELH